MRVRDIWSAPVHRVTPQDSLEHAARMMWDHDCGALPVVDQHGRLGAMITDRDVCMGAFTRGARLADLRVGDSMSRAVVSCAAEDDVVHATRLMRQHRIRRLPVIDQKGQLVGVLSLTDLARAAVNDPAIAKECLLTLQAIGARPLVVRPTTTTARSESGAATNVS